MPFRSVLRDLRANTTLWTPGLTSLFPSLDMRGRRPRWCSLVAKYSLSDMTDSAMMGCDRFVRLFRLDPGLLVGLWKVRLGP